MCKRLFAALAAVSLSLFSGCAIHPLPEDVTGVDTYHIVRQIRCETREALKELLIEYLDNLGTEHRTQHADPIARRLADKYKSDPDSINDFRLSEFPATKEYEHVINVIAAFADAGIAYTFELTMKENNDLTGGADFLKPLFSGKFTLGVGAGALRERQNVRIFTVTDTFRDLVIHVPPRYCDGQIRYANYIYPIVGRIGVYELVRTFVRLSLFGNLGGAEDKASTPTPGAPTMTDRFTFTTTINASANPSVVFTPAGTKFQIIDANLMASVKRSDMHQVTVGLAIHNAGFAALTPLRSYLFSKERLAARAVAATPPRVRKLVYAPLYQGERVIGSGTPSERLAVEAIDKLKSRELELIINP
jgi:hypothetical protein